MSEQNQEKKDWKAWLRYKIDNAFAGGAKSQFFVLLVVILGVILIAGPISALFTDGDIKAGMKNVFDHLGSWGALLGDDYTNVPYFLLMIIVSIIGIAFYSTFIGIITNAITSKADELKKGHTRIIEYGHVVVLGYSDSIHTILTEMGQSNENWTGNKKIVVIDEKDKEKMEDECSEDGDHLIFRSGDLADEHSMDIASVDEARTIIINENQDFDVVRVMMSLVSYLKKHNAYMNDKMPTIVVLMHDKACISAVQIAAGIHHEFDQDEMDEYEKKIRILYFDDILAHLFAQSCRQPGLSWVISDMFDYVGSEIYVEDVTKDNKSLDCLEGKSLAEINAALSNSIGLGVQRGADIIINPNPAEFKFQKGDKLINLGEDDNEIVLDFEQKIEKKGAPAVDKIVENDEFHFLILGWSSVVSKVIAEIEEYADAGSTITIISDNEKASNETSDTLSINVINGLPSDFVNAVEFLGVHPEITNIVIVSDDRLSKVQADQVVMMLLLNVREYLKDMGITDKINVTTEMNLPKDQKLMADTNNNDFIVGTEVANRMLVQIANNPKMHTIFRELLSDEGSEFYLRPFSSYVDTSKPFNFNFIADAASQRYKLGADKQEIAIGWMRPGTTKSNTIVKINPTSEEKSEEFKLQMDDTSYDNYKVIVVAMD